MRDLQEEAEERKAATRRSLPQDRADPRLAPPRMQCRNRQPQGRLSPDRGSDRLSQAQDLARARAADLRQATQEQDSSPGGPHAGNGKEDHGATGRAAPARDEEEMR